MTESSFNFEELTLNQPRIQDLCDRVVRIRTTDGETNIRGIIRRAPESERSNVEHVIACLYTAIGRDGHEFPEPQYFPLHPEMVYSISINPGELVIDISDKLFLEGTRTYHENATTDEFREVFRILQEHGL